MMKSRIFTVSCGFLLAATLPSLGLAGPTWLCSISESLAAYEDGSSGEIDLGAQLEALGRTLGEREAAHRADIDRARDEASKLRSTIAAALDRFHDAAGAAGAPHLEVSLSEIRPDDKHLRALEFELSRGRHRAIVVAKSRGEVTLVGPFRAGKAEGPCKSFPFGAGADIDAALATFLSSFLEEAATP